MMYGSVREVFMRSSFEKMVLQPSCVFGFTSQEIMVTRVRKRKLSIPLDQVVDPFSIFSSVNLPHQIQLRRILIDRRYHILIVGNQRVVQRRVAAGIRTRHTKEDQKCRNQVHLEAFKLIYLSQDLVHCPACNWNHVVS